MVLPLQVGGVHGLVADGALGPALVTERQVVQHARPAEDVSTARDASRHGRIEADRAGRHLVAVDALSAGKRITISGLISEPMNSASLPPSPFEHGSALTTCCTQSQLTSVSGSVK